MTRTTLPTLVAAICICSIAVAQQQQREQSQSSQEYRTTSLAVPPGESVLDMEVESPQEVRVGDEFEYRIHVTNRTDNMMLHDIRLKQQDASNVSIESSQMKQQGKSSESKQNSQGNKQKKQKQQQKQGDQASADKQQSKQKAQSKGKSDEWTISKLKPGETKTIVVTAAADKEGQADTCLAVTSYTTALCLTTKVVKPELELVKKAPEKANVCETFVVEYYVKNTGSGDLDKFTINDKLPESITTASGDKELKFQVDGLPAGEVRQFNAELRAKKAGEFSSRAVAKTADGQQTRSQQTTTAIREADLAVAIDGPSTTYVDRPMSYTIRVSNRGEAPARNARLELQFPNQLNLAQAGEISDSDNTVSSSSQTSKEPVIASNAQQQDSSQQQNQSAPNESQSQQQQTAAKPARSSHSWDLGTLEAGATKQVRVTLNSDEAGMLKQVAVAEYICGDGEHRDRVVAKANTQTEVISLPALLLTAYDETDPIAVNKETVYRVVVINQGTAADQNVQITAELPEGMEFVKADGKTDVKADGNKLNFGKIDELKAGDRAVWRVRVKPTKEGNAKFRAELSSKSLNQPVAAEEPTNVFAGGSSSSQQGSGSEQESGSSQNKQQNQKQN